MSTEERPKTLSVEYIKSVRNCKVKPIDGLNIPNIYFPFHLISKKRSTETVENVNTDIRQIFTSLTSDNVEKAKIIIKDIIAKKIFGIKDIESIAEEILRNFIVDEKNINNYLQILNIISPTCFISKDSEKPSISVGNCFLGKLRTMIFDRISTENIRELAKLELDDMDQLDIYNKERTKINNLILTLCSLYDQRNTKFIKLSGNHIYSVINIIASRYEECINKMKELGDPEEDCLDEDEYEILRKMSIIYAEHLYLIMNREASSFSRESFTKLVEFVNKFRNEIVTTIKVPWLLSKCDSIKY